MPDAAQVVVEIEPDLAARQRLAGEPDQRAGAARRGESRPGRGNAATVGEIERARQWSAW